MKISCYDVVLSPGSAVLLGFPFSRGQDEPGLSFVATAIFYYVAQCYLSYSFENATVDTSSCITPVMSRFVKYV